MRRSEFLQFEVEPPSRLPRAAKLPNARITSELLEGLRALKSQLKAQYLATIKPYRAPLSRRQEIPAGGWRLLSRSQREFETARQWPDRHRDSGSATVVGLRGPLQLRPIGAMRCTCLLPTAGTDPQAIGSVR